MTGIYYSNYGQVFGSLKTVVDAIRAQVRHDPADMETTA